MNILDFVTSVLVDAGHTVYGANSGSAAIDALDANPVALVMSDINMKGTDAGSQPAGQRQVRFLSGRLCNQRCFRGIQVKAPRCRWQRLVEETTQARTGAGYDHACAQPQSQTVKHLKFKFLKHCEGKTELLNSSLTRL